MVGWWLTDAWKHKDGKACMFSQSKPKTLEKLRIELERLKTLGKCNYSEYIKQPKSDKHNPEHTFYVTGELADYLLTNFSSREFKEEFIELNKQSKELLLQGLMDGDGSARNKEYSKVFWSQDESRNDILSALLTTMGYRNYISYSGRHKGVVFNIAHNTTEIQFKHKKPNIKYIGKVYCLQTETGAFVVRRNGKPFISGNSGFPKSMNIGLAIDKKNGVESPVIGQNQDILKKQAKDLREGHRTIVDSLDGGAPERNNGFKNVSADIREAQNEWKDWGTSLKPSYEPIIVARKPFKGSLVDNIVENGVGGLNIDECRVPLESSYEFKTTNRKSRADDNVFDNSNCGFDSENNTNAGASPKGRFPANTILTYDETDFDEVCGGFPYTKSTGGSGDEGSASRYFYCAKASKKDRDEGLEKFETKTKVFNGKSDNSSEDMKDVEKRFTTNGKNIHPTVKPTSLMQYLVRLVTPNNGTVLDPFNGSGSTGKAVMYENLENNKGYKYIGIELTPEYLPISKARLDYVCDLPRKDKEKTSLMDLLGEIE